MQAEAAIGTRSSRYAAADDAECFAGDLDPHEPVLLPLAGLGRRIGLRIWRSSASISVMACSAVVIELTERAYSSRSRLGSRGRNVDIIDARSRPAR